MILTYNKNSRWSLSKQNYNGNFENKHIPKEKYLSIQSSVVVLPKVVVKPKTYTSGISKDIRMHMLSFAKSQKCHSYFTNETNKPKSNFQKPMKSHNPDINIRNLYDRFSSDISNLKYFKK